MYEGHRFSYENMTMGLQLILWGFFKKIVIASRPMKSPSSRGPIGWLAPSFIAVSIHLIGIGGVSMNSLGELLLSRGVPISPAYAPLEWTKVPL